MPDKYHFLRIALIAALVPAIAAAKVNSAGSAPAEQTLEAICNCMARSPAPWPEEWKQEYIGTIRGAVESHREAGGYALRLEILRKGFTSYWESFEKSKDRFLFEVYRTRIRWYVEHLMGTRLLSGDEKQKLRDQYTAIWDHAASSLLAQFAFLDPKAVQAAKADDLSLCFRKIDTPLVPVYLRPISEQQVEQIKQRWEKLRYSRVDLWRRLDPASRMSSVNGGATVADTKRHYELTKKSLSQLLGTVWMVVPERPDYYVNAQKNRTRALERRYQSKRTARRDQQRLENERSRQLLQTEHISFLLAALLETPQCLDGTPSVVRQEQSPLEQQGKPAKGGDAHEVGNVSRKK